MKKRESLRVKSGKEKGERERERERGGDKKG